MQEEFGALQKVPLTARSYSFWDQLVFWFSAVSFPGAWYYGALMAGWHGLSGALFLILVCNALAFLPWAFLGYIAAKTGASSMAMVRPTFGLRGSFLPSIFYLVFGFGWGLVNTFLAAIGISFAMNLWMGWPAYMSLGYQPYMIWYLVIVCLGQGIFAISGHEMIKKLQWVATILFLLLGFYQLYVVLGHWGKFDLWNWRPAIPLGTSVGPIMYTITFPLLLDLLIAYNWTWEFIGDFSRFSKTTKAGTWGPFIGATVGQIWWFLVGALGVVYLAVSTGSFSPLLADPSATTVKLGFGMIAVFIIAASTITTNAGNIYASAMGISNMMGKHTLSIRWLLIISSLIIIPLSLLPLLSNQFVGFFMFFLDILGAIVVPLWTLVLVDFFIKKRERYSDALFKHEKGEYWYSKGFNIPALGSLMAGLVVYLVIAYGFPHLRATFTAALPTIVFTSLIYLIWSKEAN